VVAIRRRYHSPPRPSSRSGGESFFITAANLSKLQFPGTEERSEGPPQSVRAHTKLATFTAITLNRSSNSLRGISY
jgi:hypothetical protein